MFDFLTLSVVIDDAIFCVHGGLSPSIHHIDQIKIIDRFREVPHEGPMADLVWSDPDPEKEDFAISPRSVSPSLVRDMADQSRGAGYTFGASIVRKFLELNGMNHILRAHQLCMEGYAVLYNDQLSTVWSAPNYCYRQVLHDRDFRLQLMRIDAVTWRASWKSRQAGSGSLTYLTQRRKTRYVASFASRRYPLTL
jgi:serine/threonine-protein phosphatase PPG1